MTPAAATAVPAPASAHWQEATDTSAQLLAALAGSSHAGRHAEVKALDAVWQLPPHQATGPRSARTEPPHRGFGLGTVLSQAAGVVQRSNSRLAGIAHSFALEALGTGTAIFTPAGGARLMSTATAHLAKAARVVADTHDELASYGAHLRPAGPLAGLAKDEIDTPAATLTALVRDIRKPVRSLATGMLTSRSRG